MASFRSNTLFSFFPKSISSAQSKDTGMAIVLIALLAGLIFGNERFFFAAVILLVVDMTVPVVFHPVAILWLGLSFLLGSIVSRIVLSLIFFMVITPIGMLKVLCGSEPLQLKKWKRDTASVFLHRDIQFKPSDLENPF